MSKLITLFCFLSTLFCSYAVAAESVTEYPYSENFDNTAEKEMPSGWASRASLLLPFILHSTGMGFRHNQVQTHWCPDILRQVIAQMLHTRRCSR